MHLSLSCDTAVRHLCLCAHTGSWSLGSALRNEPQLTRQRLQRRIPPEMPAPWVCFVWLYNLGSSMQRESPFPVKKKKKGRSHSITLGHVNAAQALTRHCQSGLPSCRISPSPFHGTVGTSCWGTPSSAVLPLGFQRAARDLLSEQWVGVSSCCPFSLPLPSCCPHISPTSAVCWKTTSCPGLRLCTSSEATESGLRDPASSLGDGGGEGAMLCPHTYSVEQSPAILCVVG